MWVIVVLGVGLVFVFGVFVLGVGVLGVVGLLDVVGCVQVVMFIVQVSMRV